MKPKDLKKIAILLVAVFIVILEQYLPKEEIVREQYLVTRVIDGDTLVIDMNGEEERLRIIGIDTPESVRPNTPVECLSLEAGEYTKSMLENEYIETEYDDTQGNRDKYDRLLRHVFIDDINFGEKIIQDGYAYEYTYDMPYTYQREYVEAERYARENEVGLWSDSACK